MSRRRLRIVSSSDEEEEEEPPPPPPPPPRQHEEEDIDDIIIEDMENDFQTVTLNSSNPTPSSNNSTTINNTDRRGTRPSEPIPLDISDGEEENDNINTTNASNLVGMNGNTGHFQVSESPVSGVLEGLGLRLKREWLDSCLHGLQSSVPGFRGMDYSAKAKLCFAQFLWSDMNWCGAGVLPPNVHTLHSVDLKGPFVLQVDEIVNISSPLRGRYQNATAGSKRCLKLSMTDGVQRVFGMEYRPIKDLEVLAPAGLKVAICNVNIRRGLLMLVPEVLEVLGGSVDELEVARQRLVTEINKPPRGKRNRTGVVPPLAARATLSAWPPRSDSVPEHVDRNSTVNITPPQTAGLGTAVSNTANGLHRKAFTTPLRRNAEPNTSAAPQPQQHGEVPRSADVPENTPLRAAGQGCSFGVPAADKPREDFIVPVSKTNTVPSTLSTMPPPECVTIPPHTEGHRAEAITPSSMTRQGIPANVMSEDVTVPISRDGTEPNMTSALEMDAEEVSVVDKLEHHLVLSSNKEIPFTYLASLSAKCAAMDEEVVVRGKIKCFLTGVKGFQYKQRSAYDLRVYVDDGSLISEILIDHNVVQNGIGYSPEEVTSALASSNSKQVGEMKETLKQFQIFLVNFEGIMAVEMNKGSPVPVAVEMNQGCPASDARLLLKRVKSLGSTQQHNMSHLNPIDLSP